MLIAIRKSIDKNEKENSKELTEENEKNEDLKVEIMEVIA